MEISRKKIGIFDSGVGGFSILQELLNILPGHEFYYISDKPNAPYGDKDSEFIKKRCHILSEELLAQGVDLVLIACNTATAEGIDSLREKFDTPFVGIEPFVKAIETFDLKEKNVNPVVLTTPAMHESKRFQLLLDKFDPKKIIHQHPCPNLASLIERAYEDDFTSVEAQIEAELSQLKELSLTHAILGCTHYPLIKEMISEYLGVKCISPCVAVAKRVAHILKAQPLNSKAVLHFKISEEENFKSLDQTLLSLNE